MVHTTLRLLQAGRQAGVNTEVSPGCNAYASSKLDANNVPGLSLCPSKEAEDDIVASTLHGRSTLRTHGCRRCVLPAITCLNSLRIYLYMIYRCLTMVPTRPGLL